MNSPAPIPALPQGWRRYARYINDARCQWWDFLHNVDTAGVIRLDTFSFQSKNKDPRHEYSSHHPHIIRSALKSLAIPYGDYTFIDLGCGKGRVLLLASELPFRRVVGIEFCPPLAEIARRNLNQVRWLRQRCRQQEVITLDAAEYELPLEPEVLYIANPFFPPVMSVVIGNIERSLSRLPRDILILFVGPLGRRKSIFGGNDYYAGLIRTRYFDAYQHRRTDAGQSDEAA